VKAGNGAFLPEPERAVELARLLVCTAVSLGTPASALITDMSQPLGRWSGHAAEVQESLQALAGEGTDDLVEVTLALGEEVSRLVGRPLSRQEMTAALSDGRARERFFQWAELQGADPAWLLEPRLDLAPVEVPLRARRTGRLATVETRQIGLLLVEAGGGRARPDAEIDLGVALQVHARLGDEVREGEELARLYLRRDDPRLAGLFAACFEVADAAGGGIAPPLILERIV
jgi:thymidine phosphorylase